MCDQLIGQSGHGRHRAAEVVRCGEEEGVLGRVRRAEHAGRVALAGQRDREGEAGFLALVRVAQCVTQPGRFSGLVVFRRHHDLHRDRSAGGVDSPEHVSRRSTPVAGPILEGGEGGPVVPMEEESDQALLQLVPLAVEHRLHRRRDGEDPVVGVRGDHHVRNVGGEEPVALLLECECLLGGDPHGFVPDQPAHDPPGTRRRRRPRRVDRGAERPPLDGGEPDLALGRRLREHVAECDEDAIAVSGIDEHDQRLGVETPRLKAEQLRGGAVRLHDDPVLVGDEVAVGGTVEELPVALDLEVDPILGRLQGLVLCLDLPGSDLELSHRRRELLEHLGEQAGGLFVGGTLDFVR